MHRTRTKIVLYFSFGKKKSCVNAIFASLASLSVLFIPTISWPQCCGCFPFIRWLRRWPETQRYIYMDKKKKTTTTVCIDVLFICWVCCVLTDFFFFIWYSWTISEMTKVNKTRKHWQRVRRQGIQIQIQIHIVIVIVIAIGLHMYIEHNDLR